MSWQYVHISYCTLNPYSSVYICSTGGAGAIGGVTDGGGGKGGDAQLIGNGGNAEDQFAGGGPPGVGGSGGILLGEAGLNGIYGA
jgi:hypothetical protein